MDLGCNGIGDEGAKHIVNSLKNNKVMHFTYHQLYDEFLRFILQTLVDMQLYGNDISEQILEEVKQILEANTEPPVDS